MKKYLQIVVLIFISATVGYTQDNSTNQERLKKYWYLRWRLINYFTVVGDGYGMSLPASVRNVWADAATHASAPQVINGEEYYSKAMSFGDAPNFLASYIGVLATEYKLLANNSQNTNQTLTELYYAIKAINRLDECEAQYPWFKSANNLDGLCSRGDMDTGFVRDHYAELNKNLNNFNPPSPGDPSMDVLLGGHYKYSLDANTIPRSRIPDEILADKQSGMMSQDHISSVLVGLALVKKFIPSGTTINGMDLHDEAKQITKRIINYMQRCNWHLEDPDGEKILEEWGSKAWPYSYGFAKAAISIWPQQAFDFLDAISVVNKVTWDGIATVYLGATDICTILGNNGLNVGDCENSRNAWIILNLAAVGNSWETVALDVSLITAPALAPLAAACLAPGLECSQGLVWAHSKVYGWEAYYPLLHATLHNTGCLTSRETIETDLNTMPCTGHWGDHTNNNFPSRWGTPNKYHQIPEDNNNGGNSGFDGQYSGLEFMLLNNLYYLHGNNKDSEGNTLPQYENLMNFNVLINFPFPFPNFGSQTNPFTVSAFRSITAANTINAVSGSSQQTGDVTYRAGEFIELKPGFEVELGADFEAKIDPYACVGGAYQKTDGSDTSSSLYGMDDFPFVSNNYVPLEYNNNEQLSQNTAPIQNTAVEQEIKIHTQSTRITLHPNPSHSGIFEVQGLRYEEQSTNPIAIGYGEQGKSDSYRITVTNVLGETVLHHSITSSPNHPIDLSTQPHGIYFVKIQSGGEFSVHKVVYQ